MTLSVVPTRGGSFPLSVVRPSVRVVGGRSSWSPWSSSWSPSRAPLVGCCRGVALVVVLVGRCRRPWSPVLRAGRPVPSPSVVVPPCPVGVVPSPCPTWSVVRVSRGGCRGGAVKVLSSSGCRRRRAVGLSLSSRRRSSWSPWSPSRRRPSVSPRVGVACRAVAVPVAPLVGWVGFGGCRWVGVGRPGRGSSVARVALAGRRRRPVGVVPVPPCGGSSWGVGRRVPLAGGGAVAYFTLPLWYAYFMNKV